MKRWLAVFASVLASTPAVALEPASLRWLQGAWCGSAGGTATVEYWLPMDGGTMLGLHHDVKAGKTTGFEFLRIETGAAGTAYVAQPGGAPPTRFGLVEATADSLVFADPAHDFPRRIRYTRIDAGTLGARVDDGTDDGESLSWTWHRCDPHAPPK